MCAFVRLRWSGPLFGCPRSSRGRARVERSPHPIAVARVPRRSLGGRGDRAGTAPVGRPGRSPVGPDGTTADDHFFGVKNLAGIESIELSLPSSGGAEVDHVQYGDADTLTATWDDGQAIQGSGGGLDPPFWVGLELQGACAPTVTTPDSETVVLGYGGLDPNPQLQIDVASYGLPFYPPDPIHVAGNQIQIVFMQNGTMSTLTIDVTSSSGGLVDPLSVVGFNPQPEPPAGALFAFSPPPGGDSEALSIQVPLTGGSGAPGGTQISLSLQVLDNALAPLPVSPIAELSIVPTLGPLTLGLLALGLLGSGRRTLRRRRAREPGAARS